MTEKGKAVYERLIEEYDNTIGIPEPTERLDRPTRLMLNMPIPLPDDYWTKKASSVIDRSWKVMTSNKDTMYEQYALVRPMDNQEQNYGNRADGVEFFIVGRMTEKSDKFYAVTGTIDAFQFRSTDEIKETTAVLRENGLLNAGEMSAVDIIQHLYRAKPDEIIESSNYYTSYTTLYPRDIDCMVTENQLSEMFQSMGIDKELLKPQAKAQEEITKKDADIKQFRGEYSFLSNFYNAPIDYQGLTYQNNEAAFQAQKCENPGDREQFTNLNPADARSLGRKVLLRNDWEQVKFAVMEEIVQAKFIQHPELAQQLLSTGNAYLEEGNTWGDRTWGTVNGTGQNQLGKIIMKTRAALMDKEHGHSEASAYFPFEKPSPVNLQSESVERPKAPRPPMPPVPRKPKVSIEEERG